MDKDRLVLPAAPEKRSRGQESFCKGWR